MMVHRWTLQARARTPRTGAPHLLLTESTRRSAPLPNPHCPTPRFLSLPTMNLAATQTGILYGRFYSRTAAAAAHASASFCLGAHTVPMFSL